MTLFKLVTCVTVGCSLYAQTLNQTENLPEANGLELTLTGPSAPVAIGTEATVKIHLENKSDVSYRLGDTQTEFAFVLVLYDSAGSLVPFTQQGRFIWKHAHSVWGPNPFPPGDKIDVQEDLSSIFSITSPGVYLLKGYNRLVEGFKPVDSQPIKVVFESSVGSPK